MGRVTHFEIPAKDAKKLAKFYTSVFGWKITQWGNQPYWLIDTKHGKKPGIDGGIGPKGGLFAKGKGVNSYICTIEVENLEETAKKIKKAGGKWANEGGLIHGVGFHQYFYDPEGNLFGGLQPDTKAKMV